MVSCGFRFSMCFSNSASEAIPKNRIEQAQPEQQAERVVVQLPVARLIPFAAHVVQAGQQGRPLLEVLQAGHVGGRDGAAFLSAAGRVRPARPALESRRSLRTGTFVPPRRFRTAAVPVPVAVAVDGFLPLWLPPARPP